MGVGGGGQIGELRPPPGLLPAEPKRHDERLRRRWPGAWTPFFFCMCRVLQCGGQTRLRSPPSLPISIPIPPSTEQLRSCAGAPPYQSNKFLSFFFCRVFPPFFSNVSALFGRRSGSSDRFVRPWKKCHGQFGLNFLSCDFQIKRTRAACQNCPTLIAT